MKNKFLATLFLACSISTVSAQTPVYMDDAQPIEARVKDAPQPDDTGREGSPLPCAE